MIQSRVQEWATDTVEDDIDAVPGVGRDLLRHRSLGPHDDGVIPRERSHSRLAAVPTTAITCAPRRWANCDTTDPTAPAAAETSTVSPGRRAARSNPTHAVRPLDPKMLSIRRGSTPGGTG